MAIVILRLPEVKAAAEKRPSQCPHCGCAILQRWGVVEKRVIDPKIDWVVIYRYHCTGCWKTFRDYPQGITSAEQTERMRFSCALIWKMGVSLRQTTGLLGVWQKAVCHMTVWRYIQWAALQRAEKKQVRVAGLDGFYTKLKGQEKGLMVMGAGQPVASGEWPRGNLRNCWPGCCR